jgi:hypothetical protein
MPGCAQSAWSSSTADWSAALSLAEDPVEVRRTDRTGCLCHPGAFVIDDDGAAGLALGLALHAVELTGVGLGVGLGHDVSSSPSFGCERTSGGSVRESFSSARPCSASHHTAASAGADHPTAEKRVTFHHELLHSPPRSGRHRRDEIRNGHRPRSSTQPTIATRSTSARHANRLQHTAGRAMVSAAGCRDDRTAGTAAAGSPARSSRPARLPRACDRPVSGARPW